MYNINIIQKQVDKEEDGCNKCLSQCDLIKTQLEFLSVVPFDEQIDFDNQTKNLIRAVMKGSVIIRSNNKYNLVTLFYYINQQISRSWLSNCAKEQIITVP